MNRKSGVMWQAFIPMQAKENITKTRLHCSSHGSSCILSLLNPLPHLPPPPQTAQILEILQRLPDGRRDPRQKTAAEEETRRRKTADLREQKLRKVRAGRASQSIRSSLRQRELRLFLQGLAPRLPLLRRSKVHEDEQPRKRRFLPTHVEAREAIAS